MKARPTLAIAAITATLAIGACGDDGDPDEAGSGDSDVVDTTTADDGSTDDGSTDGTCAGTDVEFTNLTTGATVEVTDTAAVSLEGGAAYTTYLTDFDIDAAEVSGFSSPTVAADANMVTVFVTVYNAEEVPGPLEAGTEIEHSDEFGVLTFGVIHAAGAESFGTSSGATGSMTITAVGDTFCAEIDYADEEKTLSGSIEAEVTEA